MTLLMFGAQRPRILGATIITEHVLSNDLAAKTLAVSPEPSGPKGVAADIFVVQSF